MDELTRSIRSALQSKDRIPGPLVREWIQRASDVETDALLYQLTREGWNRIEPRLEAAETCALIQRYLLGCIRDNPNSGSALSRYEAAGELEAWFDHLASQEDTHEILRGIVGEITTLFLNGDDQVRAAVETGFLEHVLEQPRMRPLFSEWANDERLEEAWRHALAWGEAHPNFMRGLREQLRDRQLDCE
jgi:hypothetical protein